MVKITNRHHFKNLSELSCQWQLQGDDKILQEGRLTIDLPAQREKIVRLPFVEPAAEPGVEYRLFINFTLPEETAWAPKGHEVAWEQLPLFRTANTVVNQSKTKLAVSHPSASTTIVAGDFFEYSIEKGDDLFRSIKFKGEEILQGTPEVNFWRAPTANELEREWGPRILADEWRNAGLDRLDRQLGECEEFFSEDSVVIRQVYQHVLADGTSKITSAIVYTFLPTGDILIKDKVTFAGEFPEWIPRIGFALTLPEEFDNMSWYGRGPFETYPDRKTGAKVGIYSGAVEEQFVPYLIPQENGNKTDVRWVTFTNENGIGLFIAGDELLNVSAHVYSLDNLDRAAYPFQLQKDERIHVYVDFRVSGLGETPVKTLEQYRVKPGEYKFTVRLKPFDVNDISSLELGRQVWRKTR